ncbi:MAG: response regulator [Alphaproteobacteria bacterium]
MPYDFRHITCLVLDDNRHMRSLICSVLHGLGIKNIVEAGDAAVAFSELKSRPFDLVFTDYLMEPLDGLDFTRLVRTASDSPNPLVPIIMITGFTEEYRVKEARDAGVTEVMCKPVTAKGIGARVAAIIEKPRNFVKSPGYTGPDRRRGGRTGSKKDRRRRATDSQEVDIDAIMQGDGSEGLQEADIDALMQGEGPGEDVPEEGAA